MEKKRQDSNEAVAKYFKYGLIGFIALIIISVSLVMYFSYSKSYVATVGSEKISKAEFNFFLNQAKSIMLQDAGIQAGTPEDEAFWQSKLDGENAIEIAKKKALDSARELKIQVAVAKEQKLALDKDDNEKLESWVKGIIDQSGSKSKADESFEQMYGVKLDEFKAIYEEYLLTGKLIENETKDLKFSDEDIKAFFDNNLDKFKDLPPFREDAEEAVWARHILISTVDQATQKELPQDKKQEAKKKAEDLLARIKNGEDFITLAKENSEDPGSAQYGGDYVFGKGKMAPEFEKVAFELNEGEVSGLVETQFGYHIIKLEEKISKGEPVSFRCAKEYRDFALSDAQLKSEKYEQKLDEWKKDPKYDLKKKESVYNSIK